MFIDKKEEKIHKRHQGNWNFLFYSVGWIFKHINSYKCKPAPQLEGPCIILSNHTMELDPVLVALSFKKQMYFVASEHVYRKGWVSRLLFWAFEPIAKIKGASDTLTVMKTIRKLKNGYNVCIFAEGSRSFDGRNSGVSEATGKLIKISGANLVTYRIEGGYLTNPRWGFGLRRGKSFGQVVNVYSPLQLKEMTPEEITALVVKDIHEDAYERQAVEKTAYKGKARAEGIESAFCLCPRCRSLGKMASSGNKVFCTSCGNSSEFNLYGEFNEAFGVKNPEEWEDLQEAYFSELVENYKDPDTAFFADQGVSLKTVDSDHKEVNLGKGKMALYCNRFIFTPDKKEQAREELVFSIDSLPDMSVYGRNGFVFSDSDGTHYEIKPLEKKSHLNVRKYISVWKRLREKQK